MDHSPGFLKLVNEERPLVKEITLEDARRRLAANSRCVLLDVREDAEWAKGHSVEAAHLGRGVLERDIEQRYPDLDTEILMYCGGGFRSVLAASAARRMGYRNCSSVIGGYRAMLQANWPMKSGE
jgi:rhodanese-related sulfurtransferase